ncbi:hypothetical protein MLD38_001304 [Melastoma candidum]|uniref:Uncharacterized protein n=1 Tax=Melastoma candidum TaxID=119954 RepID=A0ACB9SCA5_9MYRT|nr:hypothetical protein MLD38_001304 [Melastoma candidum]
MEACFLSSNSFANAIPRTAAVRFQRRGGKAVPCSVPCMCSSSSSPNDDSAGLPGSADWRSFRARLVATERELASSRPNKALSLESVIPATVGERWAHTIHEVEKGCLLVATEKLDGVHIFERTVILVLSTGPIGPTGIILNRPSLMSMKESRSSAYDVTGTFADRELYFGGPIEDGLFLARGESGREARRSGVAVEVMEGLYYGRKEGVGCVGEMVRRGVGEVGEFRFFEGCCGWVKGQLSDEVRSGYWTVVACSQGVIGLGSVGGVGLWDDVLGLLGPKKVW